LLWSRQHGYKVPHFIYHAECRNSGHSLFDEWSVAAPVGRLK